MKTHRTDSIRWAALLTAMLLIAPAAPAAVVTLDPVADVYTLYNGAVGDGTSVAVKRGDASGTGVTRKGYIRFDLSSIDVSQVTSATFEITMATDYLANNTLYVYGHDDAVATDGNGRYGDVAWTEANAVAAWANANHVDAPANSSSTNSYIGNGIDGAVGFHGSLVNSAGLPLGTFALTTTNSGVGTVFSFTTANLLNFVSQDTNDTLTFALYVGTTTAANVLIASNEDTTYNPAQLKLTIVPAPAALPAGLALLGFAALRRRRSK